MAKVSLNLAVDAWTYRSADGTRGLGIFKTEADAREARDSLGTMVAPDAEPFPLYGVTMRKGSPGRPKGSTARVSDGQGIPPASVPTPDSKGKTPGLASVSPKS